MDAPILTGQQGRKWETKTKNLIKRTNRKLTKQILTTQHNKTKISIIQERKSRPQTKNKTSHSKERNRRETSIPHRGEKIRVLQTKTKEPNKENPEFDYSSHPVDNSQKEWIHPFTGLKQKAPITNIKVDNRTTQCCIDTGATRVMITSAMATQLWGNNYKNSLHPYPSHKKVEDAQGNQVSVEGFKQCKIQIGEHLNTKYPIVVYTATHKELLIGYSFLVDLDLAVYAGKGIGTQPKHMVKRLNFKEEPLECTALEDITIRPKEFKIVKVKLALPNWSREDHIKAIGSPIIIHSEDIEAGLPIGNITCPYVYDILSLDGIQHIAIDNMDNAEPMTIKKEQLIAHAEFVHEEVEQEKIKQIMEENESHFTLDRKSIDDIERGELKLENEKLPGRWDYIDQVNIKSHEEGTKEYCQQLLKETENFWSKTPFDIGLFDKKARMTLNTTTPIRDKFRPIHPQKQQQAQEIIDQLEKHNIIKRGSSPYMSQPVWVYKKHADKAGDQAVAGEADLKAPRQLRLALDYRRINKAISSQSPFPNPSIRDILYSIKKSKYVSIIDLTNSYWNIELTESTKRILAFQTSKAQYLWNRLPQGTSPSSGLMAHAVQDTIQSGNIQNIATCYVDNLLVMSDSLEQHKIDLKKTIQTFMKRGWKANCKKSHLMINSNLRLFGFEVNLSKGTIGPDPQKVDAILQLPTPTNQKEARSITGSINYYSELIPDLAPLMIPIHESTKNNKFEWTDQCEANFKEVKKKLATLPVVYLPDFNQKMHLFTDGAAGQFISWHISQWSNTLKKFVPISFGSHKLAQAERSYSQCEVEMFAIIYALTQESLLLSFSKIILHTDCKSLTFLFRFNKVCSKLNRWQLILNSYDIEICFEPSQSIGIMVADLLTRRGGPRQKVTRRPKKEEIEELPTITLPTKSIKPLEEVKLHIDKELSKLKPLTNELIKRINEKDFTDIAHPTELDCNKIIAQKIASPDQPQPLEPTQYNNAQKQYIYTPDEARYKTDTSSPGRLINTILTEAPGMSLEALRYQQQIDPVFGPILQEMKNKGMATQHTDYAIKDGILLKQVNEDTSLLQYTICVPKSLAMNVITKFHHNVFSGHPDLKKMLINLKRRFYIKNMKNICIEVAKKCQICTLNKSFSTQKQPFGQKIQVTGPRQIYALDICSVDTQAKSIDPQLPTSFLIVVDAWSLYAICIPINADATAQQILEKFLLHVIQPFGYPKIGIVTDGGSNFSNNLTNTFSSITNLQQYRISPRNPRSNIAERVNRAILSGLRYAMQQHSLDPNVYKNLISYIVLAWNTTALSSISFSPYELFLSTSYEPAALQSFVTIQEAEKQDYGQFISSLVKTQEMIQNLVNQKYKQIRDKRYALQDKKAKHSEYAPGAQVMIRKEPDATKRQHKLRPRWDGPYKVIKEFQNNVEVIPWMANRRVKLISKYKNEAKNIPKHDKYLISKDRLKPCSDVTFYYDDELARAFYQTFWDEIRDVAPITEVIRHHTPNQFINKTPTHRPTSLILPIQLGIKNIPVPKHHYQKQSKKTQPITQTDSSTIRSHPSSNYSSKKSIRRGRNTVQPIQNNNVETNSSSSSSSSEDDNHDHPTEVQQRTPTRQANQRRYNTNPTRTPPQIGRRIEANFQNQDRIHQTGQLDPWITPIRTPGHARPLPRIQIQTPETNITIQPEDQPDLNYEQENPDQQQSTGDNNQNKQEGSTRSHRSRIDPAIKEVLTSNNSIFSGEEFDQLRNYYKQGNMEQAIQSVEQQIQKSHDEIQDILQETSSSEN